MVGALVLAMACQGVAQTQTQAGMQAAQGPAWVNQRGVWTVITPQEPPPIVDVARATEQMDLGCGAGGVRFGDTAAMRLSSDAQSAFTRDARRLASAATLTDDPAQAAEFLAQAIADAAQNAPDGAEQQHLEALAILTALQHGDEAQARARLAAIDVARLGDGVAADVLFWRVLLAAPTANAGVWEDRLLPDLDTALARDPSSFQVLVWRVIGWIEANGDGVPVASQCAALGRALSDRVLDLSATGACPLMLGHMDLALARHFRDRVSPEPATGAMTWRQFSTGILAVLARDDATALAMQGALMEAQAPCGATLSEALSAVRGGR